MCFKDDMRVIRGSTRVLYMLCMENMFHLVYVVLSNLLTHFRDFFWFFFLHSSLLSK